MRSRLEPTSIPPPSSVTKQSWPRRCTQRRGQPSQCPLTTVRLFGEFRSFALQLAAASGATVIATSSSDEKLQKAKELGATHLINYAKTPDWDQEVLKLTNGEGVQHVIEVGGPSTIDKSLNCLRMGEYVHVIGFLGGMKSDEQTPLPLKVLFKAASVRGILIGSVAQFEDMNRAIEAHKIQPVVDTVFDFEDAPAAYKRLESQKHIGKVVIRVVKN